MGAGGCGAACAALVTTRSYHATASAALQRQIRERAVALLADRFPDVDYIELPYRTHCYRTRLTEPTVEADAWYRDC